MSLTSLPPRRGRRQLIRAGAAAALVALLGTGVVPAIADDEVTNEIGSEPYRPGLHYSPAQNWMNDPNGLVYHDGVYHLYYQHNPYGNSWGNMSWGHATSEDLMNWTEQPLAIPQTFDEDDRSIEDIFSGSIVVDHNNTSGFGTAEEPPLVALYTSAYTQHHPEHAGKQAQSVAYSTDGGYTWTKYEGNPVADRDSANFRDPKVFWYEGETPEDSYWVMVAVEAVDYEVVLYKSDNLIDWEYLSTFGPANAVGGIWECPDLFELPIDGDPNNTRWVMVVNLNPGAVGGGSGGQYFVGDFDGVEFTAENIVEGVPVPEGELLQDFEAADYGEWVAFNDPASDVAGPFGAAPADGSHQGQMQVTGFLGDGLVNSFLGGDGPVGSLESPAFTIDGNYLSFLVGGGNHPHVPGAQLENEPPAGDLLWDGFELPDGQTLADIGWEGTGDLAASDNPVTAGGENYLGEKRINTWEGGPNGDDNVGSLTSPEFTIDGNYLSMLVGGGARADSHEETLQVQLLVDGEVVRHLTGPEHGSLNWRHWDISDLAGQDAQLRILDEATGGWGHLTLDHVVIGDEPARVRSDEVGVNLIVDGQIVRTATGGDSESLDWHSWDLADLQGEEATIRIVDNNRGGWGHILADHFIVTEDPVDSVLEDYLWLDWGRDYYATVSYSNVPDDKRIMTGWMNNWQYAGDTPTSPWRSAMTLAREVTLTDTGAGIELRQQVVDTIENYYLTDDVVELTDVEVAEGTHALPASGDLLQIDVTLDMGDAERAGLVIRGSEGFAANQEESTQGAEGTLVGYDASVGRMFVDRTRSGEVDFNASFPSVSSAPVASDSGVVSLRMYVDRASVEVFAAEGTRTITDLIFPSGDSQNLAVFAEGGQATVESLTITPLRASVYADDPDPGTKPTLALAALTKSLDGYIAAGEIAGPITHQLTNALEQARRHLEAERPAPAISALERFVRQLDNVKRPDTVSESAREDLRAQAEAILKRMRIS